MAALLPRHSGPAEVVRRDGPPRTGARRGPLGRDRTPVRANDEQPGGLFIVADKRRHPGQASSPAPHGLGPSRREGRSQLGFILRDDRVESNLSPLPQVLGLAFGRPERYRWTRATLGSPRPGRGCRRAATGVQPGGAGCSFRPWPSPLPRRRQRSAGSSSGCRCRPASGTTTVWSTTTAAGRKRSDGSRRCHYCPTPH
jgi:hypothetical protein